MAFLVKSALDIIPRPIKIGIGIATVGGIAVLATDAFGARTKLFGALKSGFKGILDKFNPFKKIAEAVGKPFKGLGDKFANFGNNVKGKITTTGDKLAGFGKKVGTDIFNFGKNVASQTPLATLANVGKGLIGGQGLNASLNSAISQNKLLSSVIKQPVSIPTISQIKANPTVSQIRASAPVAAIRTVAAPVTNLIKSVIPPVKFSLPFGKKK